MEYLERQTRGNEEAFARLTGIGLLVEIAGCGLVAFFAYIFGELSWTEQITTIFLVAVGVPAGWLLLFVPRMILGTWPGRMILGLVAVSQLALLAVFSAQIIDFGDPGLGVDPGAIAFRLGVAAVVVLILTGSVRGLTAVRADQASSSLRRTVSRAGLIAAVLCLSIGAAVAGAGSAGIRCSSFHFDPDRWRSGNSNSVHVDSDRERMAATLVDCGTLIGKARPEVHAMLGPGGGQGSGEHFHVGVVGDGIGPGDAQSLLVHYEKNRVRRAVLSPDLSD
jgi:hypothetical protein